MQSPSLSARRDKSCLLGRIGSDVLPGGQNAEGDPLGSRVAKPGHKCPLKKPGWARMERTLSQTQHDGCKAERKTLSDPAKPRRHLSAGAPSPLKSAAGEGPAG